MKPENISIITGKFIRNGKMYCDKANTCIYKEGMDACMGMQWGDIDSKILLIAESPAGKDIIPSGEFSSFENTIEKVGSKGSNTIYAIREFFQKKFIETPHFTDVVKCGFGKGKDIEKNKNRSLRKRFENCKEFLKKEIEEIKPESVFCVGKKSFDLVMKFKDEIFGNEKPQIYFLTHYGNQANLQINLDYKKKILWDLEINYQKGKEAKLDLKTLKFYQNLSKNG